MKAKAVSGVILTLLLIGILALAPKVQKVEAQGQLLFKVTIIAPGNGNLLRRQWAHMFADSLQQLGIDAQVVYLGWASVYDRVFTPPPNIVGKTYDEGGFDIQLVSWTPGLVPQPRDIFYASPEHWPPSQAPGGRNYYLWNNTQSNFLLDTFVTSTESSEQNQTLQAWQSLFFNEVPCSQIFYSTSLAVVTPELGGLALGDTITGAGPGWLYFNTQPRPELLTGKTSVVYASTGEIESLIPPLSNYWYDTIINSLIFNGLSQVATDLSDLSIPALLTSWMPSNDGYKWTFNCRTGVKWHDGADFTADDVVFSLWALMNNVTFTQRYTARIYQTAYGDNVKFTFANGSSITLGTGTRVGNVTAVDADTVEVWLPELALGKPYGYFDPYLLSFANNIIPKHIFENMDPADWTGSPFNTGEGTIVVPGTPGTIAPETYNGPVGTGPYKWVDFDPVAQLVTLEKFTNYWNATALESDGLFGVEDYYIRFIADKTPALAALKNEEVDMLDSHYFSFYVEAEPPTVDPSWGKILLFEDTSRQEAGYNYRHPVFGTGVDTPLGQSVPSRAAEAARYVRIAFDYAMPRQLIIDNLLAGYARPGATTILPTQPYYNSSINSRPYDLFKAKEYLEKAGYTVPLRLRTETSVEVGGNEYPVTIVSNTTVDQVVATPNTLHFESSGPTGEKGYINITFPMVNTTEIKIFVDGEKLIPPPFPTITTNSTHYFIYFEFTLSTHNITIQFAPYPSAVEDIYIRADGKIDPPTANITTVDNATYTFNDNNYDSIIIERDNIVIDGAGYVLQGTGNGTGIDLSGRSNVTITNITIKTFEGGIFLNVSSNNEISRNRIVQNDVGITLENSSNNNVVGNNVTSNDFGASFFKSSKNDVSDNVISENTYAGISLWVSDSNRIQRNAITKNLGDGILVYDYSFNNTILGNNVINNGNGIFLTRSSSNSIARNKLETNFGGIFLLNTSNNIVFENNITNNEVGIAVEESLNNRIYHNLMNNPYQVYVPFSGYPNFWDNSIEGNYWSDYNGADTNQDGIGDTSYVIDANNTDNYPLMGMFSDFKATSEHHVQIICNSTVSDFLFEYFTPSEIRVISFDVMGEDATTGFCRICIPRALMNEPYTVLVNATEVSYNLLPFSNDTHSYLYFTYSHSTQEVIIIPEFPSFLILQLFIITTLMAVVYVKRRKKA